MNDSIARSLAELNRNLLQRATRAVVLLSSTEVEIDGQRLTLFCGNDYLGLSAHPKVSQAVADAATTVGMGPRGSALICGHTDWHARLETALASHERAEAVLLFPSGYAANVGTLVALGSADTTFFSDQLNHASIIDGCRLAQGAVQVYRHRDIDHLQSLLLQHSTARRKVIVTDAVFSMDGVMAPLPQLVELKHRHGALLAIDEAHATLVYGPRGGGVAEHFDLVEEVDLRVGTLSKAFGALGGFVATSRELRAWILNNARSYIYTTALPVPVVAGALAALRVATTDNALRDALWRNVAELGRLLGRQLTSPIVPIVLDQRRSVLDAAKLLHQRGLFVSAIRPPTVPEGTSRLRVTLSAAHRSQQIASLAAELLQFVE